MILILKYFGFPVEGWNIHPPEEEAGKTFSRPTLQCH